MCVALASGLQYGVSVCVVCANGLLEMGNGRRVQIGVELCGMRCAERFCVDGGDRKRFGSTVDSPSARLYVGVSEKRLVAGASLELTGQSTWLPPRT